MKTLGYIEYIWEIIINTIAIVVVLAIFSVATTKFETVVLTALVLIYSSIWMFKGFYGIHQFSFWKAFHDELRTIKRLLNKEGQETEEEIITRKGIHNEVISYYISVFFQGIIYIIAIYHLWLTLYS